MSKQENFQATKHRAGTHSIWDTEKQGCPVTVGIMQLDSRNPINRKGFFLPSNPAPCFTISIKIKVESLNIHAKTLLNTGVSACFMDEEFAHQRKIEVIRKKIPTPVEVIDGRPHVLGDVVYEIQPLEVILGEQISSIVFNIIKSPTSPIIFGFPWFELQNPNIDWRTRRNNSRSRQSKKKTTLQPLFVRPKAFMHAIK